MSWKDVGGLVALVGLVAVGVAAHTDLRRDVASLKEIAAGMPSAAVIAFDREEGCPDGWQPHDLAAGRMIIGVGEGPGLAVREFRAIGGEEAHVLTLPEVTAHSHGYGDIYFAEINGSVDKGLIGNKGDWDHDNKGHQLSRGTSNAGEGKPHNNMPPFIALHICRKI